MSKIYDMISIEVTNICNARCSFCPREKMTRRQGVMDFGLFKKIIDECAKNGVGEINITGYGEPLIDKNLVKKVEYIKSKYNPIISITTNGSLLTKNLSKDLINSGLDEINISVYSTKKETQPERIDYKKISANIIGFSALRNGVGKKLPRLVARFTCNTANKEEIGKWEKEWKGIFDEILYQNLHNFAGARNYNPIKTISSRMSCMYPETKIQIEWDGNVVGCCFDFDEKFVLGNVRKNSIYEILHKKQYKELLRNLALRRFNGLPLCNECDQLIPLTLGNVIKRIFYLSVKRPMERKRRKNLFIRLRQKK